MSSGYAQLGSLEIRARAKGQRLQIVETGVNRLVVERALNVIIVGDRFEPQELAERGKRLDFREPGSKNVRLELQQLQFDFEQVPFAHVAGFKAGLADINRLLKAVVVLLGEIEGGLREQNVDELLGDIKSELALVVGHLSTSNGGLIFSGLQAMLTLSAALEKVTNAQVELRLVFEVIRGKVAGLEKGKELRIPRQRGIRAKIGGDFLGLILQDGRAGCEQSVIVL